MVSLQKWSVKLDFGFIVFHTTLLQKKIHTFTLTTKNYFHENSEF